MVTVGWGRSAYSSAVARSLRYGIDNAVFEAITESADAREGERDFRLVAVHAALIIVNREAWGLRGVLRSCVENSNPLPLSHSLDRREIRLHCPENRRKSPQFLTFSLDWTGESVALNSSGELSSLFLWRAVTQSGFNASSRRMHCDHKPMMWRKRP